MARAGLSAPPRRVGVAVKTSNPEAATLGAELLRELARRGVEGVVDAESAQILGVPGGPPRWGLGREVDLVFVLGGDGTFLSVARGCPRSTPVAGINLGTLGFLTEHAPERTFSLLDDILEGRVEVEERDRLRVSSTSSEHEPGVLILNDVVITKATMARIVTIFVEVDGEFLSSFRADGLILSSPTGSTAYNLSAGGPIVHPGLSALLITPICSHTLTNRPLVVPSRFDARAWVEKGNDGVWVTLDGQLGFPLERGASVTVSPSPESLSVVRERGSSFFGILHHKLKWGEREL